MKSGETKKMEITTELRGKRAICSHANRCWQTLLKLKESHAFPMSFIAGRWVSDAEEIREWTRLQLRRR